jgi:hypothetical protein
MDQFTSAIGTRVRTLRKRLTSSKIGTKRRARPIGPDACGGSQENFILFENLFDSNGVSKFFDMAFTGWFMLSCIPRKVAF